MSMPLKIGTTNETFLDFRHITFWVSAYEETNTF